MDIDAIFDASRTSETWRDRLTGEALDGILAVEARIEAGARPTFTKIAEELEKLGVDVSPGAIGAYYRKKYPALRKRD